MINTIRLAALRNNEYAQFLQNFLNALSRYQPAKLKIQNEYKVLLDQTAAVRNALNEDTGSKITQELQQLDARRDDAISGIISLVNGSCFSKDAKVKAAAKLLADHLEGFGGAAIARDSYQTETSKLQKIVQDWTGKPELKAAVSLLKLDDWKAELAEANTAFDNRYVDRSVAMGTSGVERVYEQRPAINKAYCDLTEMLHARYVVEGKSEPWSTAVAAVNGVIKDYNDLVAARGGRKDAGDGTGAAKSETVPVA